MAAKSTSQLVAALDSPNGWQRDKAQQLLLWKADKTALPALEKAALESASPYARLHALCTLDGLNALKPALVERALQDKHPGVRINVLRLAETHPWPGVIAAAAKLVGDSDPKVRLQLALSLGEWKDAAAGEALAKLASMDHSDPFLRAAVLSSAVPHRRALVDAAVRAGEPVFSALADPLATLLLALDDGPSVNVLLAPVLKPENGRYTMAQLNTFSRFLDTMARMKSSRIGFPGGVDALVEFSQRTARADNVPTEERTAAAAVLARIPATRNETLTLLAAWLEPRQPAELQHAAIRAMAATADKAVPGMLLDRWPAASPELRAVMLDTFMSREPWVIALLESLKAERVSPLIFDASRRAQLQRHQSQDVRGLVNQLFKAGASSRAKLIEQFRPALALKGDVPRGQVVYAKLCASCHKLGDTGNEVGPDLRSVVEHPPEKLLVNILDPSSDVQPGYFAYTVLLKNGEELYGLITSEAGNSLVLKLSDGSTRAILRNDVESLRGSNSSLMPEGLEAALSLQDMADLIHFLRTPRGSNNQNSRSR